LQGFLEARKVAQSFVLAFVFLMPASMFCWATAFLGAGYFRDPADQRTIFRVRQFNGLFRLAFSVFGDIPAGPNAAVIGMSGVGIVFFNYLPVAAVITNRVGPAGPVLLAYFLVQGVWLTAVGHAARSRRHGPAAGETGTSTLMESDMRNRRGSGPSNGKERRSLAAHKTNSEAGRMQQMVTGRWTALDPEYGECTVLGSSRLVIAMCGGFALVLLPFVGQTAIATALGRSDTYATPSNIAAGVALELALWLGVWYLWQARLLIGERGFRYVRPFGLVNSPVQAAWNNVAAITYAPAPLAGGRLTISLRDRKHGHGGTISLPSLLAFSAGGKEVCELMNERLAASRGE
jgi:hypothetical protein